MKQEMLLKKYLRKVMVAGLLAGFVLSCAVGAAAAGKAGSAEDPLVSKSWVDGYVQEQFEAIKSQIDELKEKYSTACHIQLVIGNRTAYVNDKAVQMDTAAAIMGAGYTMTPARMIGESLGMTVAWDAAARKVTYTYGKNTMVLTIGSTKATINGKAYTLPYAPVITAENRTLVHVRFAEALGCTFAWDAAKRQVDIYRN